MAIKKRTLTLTTDASGDASGTLGLGAKYGKVVALRLDSGADTSSDYTIKSTVQGTDENILVATGVDASTPIIRYVGPVPTRILDAANDAGADAEGTPIGVLAQSPVSVVVANGGNAETHVVELYVEV